MVSQPQFAAVALCDRAAELLADGALVNEDTLLSHVYGGPIPAALRQKLSEPLLADNRLERTADGRWSLRGRTALSTAFTALALVATGPTPGRGHLVRVSALHIDADEVVQRFDVIVNPEKRVPRYVCDRAGIEAEALNAQPTFGEVVDELVRFLGDRPVLAQDVRLAWSFLDAEARQHGVVLREPTLLDANDLATRQLNLTGKPTLGAVAAHIGISSARITRTDEEARVLGLVGIRLLAAGALNTEAGRTTSVPLRRGATARALPDEPGVYVLRDAEQQPLYVGKARRLRSRMAAYVHRPLGATRRLEGLVGSVDAVDTTQCQTDLEALILEDRQIRLLQPRFNTVRQQRPPRYWILKPPMRASASRGRPLAPPRLELCAGPESADGEWVGPFRNEMLAAQARQLARDVFELDALHRARAFEYAERLEQAWRFLHGESADAEALARTLAVTLLRRVLTFEVSSMLLPADPRHARYAVVRPGPTGLEGFLLDRAILRTWTVLAQDDAFAFVQRLLAPAEPRTTSDDVAVVLRWFGAQRPPARLVLLSDDNLAAADAIEDAVYALVPET
jgi:DNA polymerase III epsilon subunit-like protein